MNMLKKIALAGGIGLLMPISASASTISLIGETISVTHSCNLGCGGATADSVTVDNTLEFVDGDSSSLDNFLLTGEFLDFDATSISFSSSGDLAFGLHVTGYSGVVTALSTLNTVLDPSTDDYISFTNDGTFTDGVSADGKSISFLIRMFSLTSGNGDTASLDITFQPETVVPAVPLPAGAGLLLTGLFGLGGLTRLRRKN
jgi:hypothetical protein